jgi:hypothetical protein
MLAKGAITNALAVRVGARVQGKRALGILLTNQNDFQAVIRENR